MVRNLLLTYLSTPELQYHDEKNNHLSYTGRMHHKALCPGTTGKKNRTGFKNAQAAGYATGKPANGAANFNYGAASQSR